MPRPLNNKNQILRNKYRHWKQKSQKRFQGDEREVTITFVQWKKIKKKTVCYYCKEKGANTLDRINPNKGYISGNVVSCCERCNCAKGNLTKEEFIDMCNKVSKRFTRQNENIFRRFWKWIKRRS